MKKKNTISKEREETENNNEINEENEEKKVEEDEEEIESILTENDKNIHINCINSSLINLSLNKPTIKKKQFEEKVREKIEKLNSIAELLYKVIIKFNDRIDFVMKDERDFKNPFKKYIFLLKYYEHVVIRPAYKLINLFLINVQCVLGRDCNIYKGIILELLKLTVKLYIRIEKLKIKAEEVDEIDREEKYYAQCFEKPSILRYENVSVKRNLLQKDFENISEDVKRMIKFRHFYTIDFFKILIKNLETILYIKPKLMESVKSKTTLTIRPDVKAEPDYIVKMNEMIEEYQTSFEKTFDVELTLFNALKESEKEMDFEIGKELMLYLLNKMADDLTDENCYYYDYEKVEYREAYLSKITIRHFKLQNSNVITFLNCLFYNYSEQFQSYLKESIGKYFDNIFLFLVINIVFACNINENMKLYNLDQIIDYNANGERNHSICADLCNSSIKLIQNMCEGHNQIFQQRFFNYKFNIDSLTYMDKKLEKEIDFNKQKEEDDEFYAIYNINKTKKNKKQRREKIIPSKRALMLNSKWFKNIFLYLNDPKHQPIFRIPELKIIDILRIYMEQLDQRKKEGKNLDEIPDKVAEEEKKDDGKNDNRRQMHDILQEFLKKPIHLSGSLRASRKDNLLFENNDKEEEQRDKQYIKEKKYSFLNFIINNMRLIIDNIHISSKLTSQMFKDTQKLKSTEDIIDIYQHFSDLIVEMIQGTGIDNFDNFYKKLTKNHQVLDEGNNLNSKSLQSFLFIHHCLEMANLLWEGNNLFAKNFTTMCLNLFQIINNIISQQLNDIALIKILTKIFPPEKLLNVICEYVKGLFLHHIEDYDYHEEKFEEDIYNLEFDMESFNKLKDAFKSNQDIYEDTLFSLASKMYLFITTLGKNYQVEEAIKVLDYEKKELHKSKKSNSDQNKSLVQVQSIKEGQGGISSCPSFLSDVALKKKKQKYKNNKGNAMSKINNYIITAKFFKKVIKNCEFMIENSGRLNLKTIYFIIDPRVYYIDKSNIDRFFDEVDRSSSTTKLKALIQELNKYLYEVVFKYEEFQKNPEIKELYSYEYKALDRHNFYIATVINFILMFFLDKKDLTYCIENLFIYILSILQILYNAFYLVQYYKSRYKFNILLEESKYEGKEMNIIEKAQVYVLDSFIFHEEIFLMILIIISDLLALISDKFRLLYSLQLLSSIKINETIKIIVMAFHSQIDKLASILGFLLIFIFFYANISFTFLKNEFTIEIEGGTEGNVCSSLLECTLTYFNHGVRSGGGIGDILPETPYTDAMYFFRFFNDFIFYICVGLMLLNMINGVIVSRFSEIREKTNFKENDQKNKCFICNIDRAIFERNKIKFEDHKKYEHSEKTYIRFLVGLKLINEKDLDADQSFIFNCIQNEEIKVFPVGVSSSIGAENEYEGEEEEEEEE